MDSPSSSEDKPDSDSLKSDYSKCYKNNHRTVDFTLQQRRETFLNEHKEKHTLVFDERRDLSELFTEYDCETDETDTTEVESMEVDRPPPRKRIKFRMTMSEWFTQIPEDLSDNWLFKLCPLGKRRLVISQKGKTKCFNKFGHRLFKFASSLPGGGTRKTQKEGLTVLDCILNENTKTFFVLDMLVWNSASFLDCEAELRLCWIRSRYEESPEIFTPYGKDSYQFKVLLDHPADIETIKSEMWQYDSQNEVNCDGLIFYHREAPYVSGETPLVTWLRPFMLPEKLNIDIPQKYERRRPSGYVTLESYIIYASERRRRRQWKKMETEEIPVQND